MAAVRRQGSLERVLDLTRRLAEEFDSVPIPMVTSAVRNAVQAAELFGGDVTASLDTIERLAREDLTALAAARAEQSLHAAQEESVSA